MTMHAGTQGGPHPLDALPDTYLRTKKIPGPAGADTRSGPNGSSFLGLARAVPLRARDRRGRSATNAYQLQGGGGLQRKSKQD